MATTWWLIGNHTLNSREPTWPLPEEVLVEVGVDLECLLDEVVAADAEHLEDPDVVQVDLQVEALKKRRKKAAPTRANLDGLPISCGQLAGIVKYNIYFNFDS